MFPETWVRVSPLPLADFVTSAKSLNQPLNQSMEES